MSTSGWARVSGAMGIPIVVAYILILALTGNSPDDGSSDQKILSYYSSHSHRVRDLTVFFVAVASLALFIWFLGHVRMVLASAEGGTGRAAGVAIASGGVFVALFAVAGSLFTVPAFVVSDAGHKFALDPNTFRLVNGAALLVFVAAFIAGSLLPFAVGVVAWRTRVLPRWLAVVSFLGGIGALAAVVFFPSFVYMAWILLLSVYLLFRPVGTQPASVAAETA